MDLYTKCNSCKEEISIKSNASTRTDLEMEKGEKFQVNCSSCGINQEKHVNDIRAKQSNLILFGGLGISLVVTILLIKILGLIGTITLTIPLIIWKQQSSSIHAFNAYRGRRS